MKRNRYHILYKKDEWILKKEGKREPLKSFRTKKEAEDYGRKIARKEEPSQLILHKKDGKIEKEYTYGQDPRKYKG